MTWSIKIPPTPNADFNVALDIAAGDALAQDPAAATQIDAAVKAAKNLAYPAGESIEAELSGGAGLPVTVTVNDGEIPLTAFTREPVTAATLTGGGWSEQASAANATVEPPSDEQPATQDEAAGDTPVAAVE